MAHENEFFCIRYPNRKTNTDTKKSYQINLGPNIYITCNNVYWKKSAKFTCMTGCCSASASLITILFAIDIALIILYPGSKIFWTKKTDNKVNDDKKHIFAVF